MKKIIITIVVFIFVLIFSSPAVFFFITNGDGKKDEIVYFEVVKGDSIRNIANKLAEEKLIKPYATKVFALMSKYLGYDRKIRTGYYKLNRSMNMVSILKELSSGKQILDRFTIVEGKNVYEIADTLSKLKLVGKEEFLTAVSNKTILDKYGINANTAEGYLFPSTYYIARGNSAEKFVTTMLDAFFAVFPKEKIEDRGKELGLSMHQIVTLASIIEKEAGAEDERPIVASVFYNRLEKKIRLESCATTIYALVVRSGGENPQPKLEAAHTRIDMPYNTYKKAGLPPGPISSVSKSAMTAALYPAKTDFLFFVSMRNGKHAFTKDYKEHEINIDKYLK